MYMIRTSVTACGVVFGDGRYALAIREMLAVELGPVVLYVEAAAGKCARYSAHANRVSVKVARKDRSAYGEIRIGPTDKNANTNQGLPSKFWCEFVLVTKGTLYLRFGGCVRDLGDLVDGLVDGLSVN